MRGRKYCSAKRFHIRIELYERKMSEYITDLTIAQLYPYHELYRPMLVALS